MINSFSIVQGNNNPMEPYIYCSLCWDV